MTSQKPAFDEFLLLSQTDTAPKNKKKNITSLPKEKIKYKNLEEKKSKESQVKQETCWT